jgi:hypothetical protein
MGTIRRRDEVSSIKKFLYIFFARLGFSRANNDTSDTTGNAVLYGIKVTSLVEIFFFPLGFSLNPRKRREEKKKEKKKKKKKKTGNRAT